MYSWIIIFRFGDMTLAVETFVLNSQYLHMENSEIISQKRVIVGREGYFRQNPE